MTEEKESPGATDWIEGKPLESSHINLSAEPATDEALRQFAQVVARDVRVVLWAFEKHYKSCRPKLPQGAAKWSSERRTRWELDQRIAAGWSGLRAEYPGDWDRWLAHKAKQWDAHQKASEVAAGSPWKGRPGWETEPELPIKTITRKGVDGEIPVEQGYVLYNRLITELGYRPFRTVNGGCRVAIPGAHGLDTYDPSEEGFQKAIAYELFTLQGQPVPRAALAVAVEALIGRARSRALPREREIRLALRVSAEAGVSRLDLMDESRRCVAITADGWEIESIRHPVFDQRLSMKALPEPSRDAGPDGWRRFERVWDFISLPPASGPDDPRLLATALLVHLLLAPRSPKPIALFGGDEGSGKSTAAARFQEIVDPSTPRLVGASTLEDPKELINLVMNHAVLNVDNVSHISATLSDDLARLSTGIGFAKRELFTDSGEVVGDACPLVILNGITATPWAPDLLRRITFLPVVSPARTVPVEQLDREWEAAHPLVLGGLLDLAVRTLQVLRDNPPPLLPNSMADHVRIGQAVAVAMGRPREDFVAAWAFNVDRQGAAAAENPWVATLADFFGARSPSSEAVRSDALAEWITQTARGHFPKGVTAEQVGRQILRVRKTLARMGIRVGIRKLHGRSLYYREADEESPKTPALDDASQRWGGTAGDNPTYPTYPTPDPVSTSEKTGVGFDGATPPRGTVPHPSTGWGSGEPHPNPTPNPTPLSPSEKDPRGGVGGVISTNPGKEDGGPAIAGRADKPEGSGESGAGMREEWSPGTGGSRRDWIRKQYGDMHPEDRS